MKLGDREEFDRQLSLLCAGFNVPIGDRSEAYWKGLQLMGLVEFARLVEYALGENGPDKIPTTPQLWKLRKSMRVAAPAQVEHKRSGQDPRDHLEYFANRLLLDHAMARGGLGSTGRFIPAYGMVDCEASPELAACLTAKRKLIEWFTSPVREGDPDCTPREFITLWINALRAIPSTISDKALARYRSMMDAPGALEPFPTYMARELEPQQRSLVA